jgi:glycosyltransferase involved in cell wall biosynthesis
LKLGWVTPCQSRSAISRFSRLVANALAAEGHDVTIVRSESDDGLKESSRLAADQLLEWNELLAKAELADEFDLLVYNFGDNYPFHAGAIPLLTKFHGVVIFHDYVLLSLFRGAWKALGGKIFTNRLLDELYGAGAALRYQPDATGEVWYDYMSRHFPMTEWIGRLAYGAVAHSHFYAERLRRCCSGPTMVIPLAYDSLREYEPLAGWDQREKIVLLTFGVINSNKRVETVVRALSSSPILRQSCEYQVIGAITATEKQRLFDVAHALSFAALEILGEVNDEVLATRIEAADVICGLRWPALEGASASAVEAMMSGRPLIVTDTGFYHELPDDLVFKVDPASELESLTHHLLELVRNPLLRRDVGRKAAAWAKSTFSVQRYVRQLVPFLEEVVRFSPVLKTAEHFGGKMAELGLRKDDPAAGRIASTMAELFSPSHSRNVGVSAESS